MKREVKVHLSLSLSTQLLFLGWKENTVKYSVPGIMLHEVCCILDCLCFLMNLVVVYFICYDITRRLLAILMLLS